MSRRRLKLLIFPLSWLFVILLGSCKKDDIDAEVLKEFEGSDVTPEVLYTSNGDLSIRYIRVNHDPDKPTVIFIHGAPGGADNYYDYLKDPTLIDSFNLITIDRLGYGGSNRGEAEPSIQKQAESVYPIIDELLLDSQQIVMLGHSYGGPVIAKIAMDRPMDVDGLLFLAPTIDPKNEKFEWAGKLGCSAPTKWLTPKDMETAAVEKSNHVKELEGMLDDWISITCQVTYVHGDDDGIVPFANYAFAKEKLAHTDMKMVAIEDGNHFIPFQQQDMVKDFLFELVR